MFKAFFMPLFRPYMDADDGISAIPGAADPDDNDDPNADDAGDIDDGDDDLNNSDDDTPPDDGDADHQGEPEQGRPKQSAEENHKFAEFRRKSEAEIARAAGEADRVNQLANMLFESAYKGETNPYTGKPIETIEDFVAWKEENERQALQRAGLSPDYIKQMIENHPVIKQAGAIIQQNQQTQGRMAFDRELAEIQKINPKIKSIDDLVAENVENEAFNALVKGGMSLSKAYATVNKIPQQKKPDNTKDHLQSVGGGGAAGTEVEIPKGEFEFYRDAFPNDTPAQLRTRYNRVLKRQGE